jgi:hypothetical protein
MINETESFVKMNRKTREYLFRGLLFLFMALSLCFSRPIQFTIIDSLTGDQAAAVVHATQNGQAVVPQTKEADVNPYKDQGRFYTMGSFTLDLAPGDVTVNLEKGYIFRPAIYSFTVPDTGSSNVTLKIYPWIDNLLFPWYTGDTHTHFPPDRTVLASTKHLSVTAGVGLNFGYLLSQNSHGNDNTYNPDPTAQWYYAQLAGYGDLSDYGVNHYYITSGHEYHAVIDGYGHASMLCIDSLPYGNGPNTASDRFPPFSAIYDQVKALNGYMGHDHHGEVTLFYIDAALWKSDFKERDANLDPADMSYIDWFRIMNSGRTVSFATGQDYELNTIWDWVRGYLPGMTFVYCGETESARSWAQHLKWGMSFITNGPLVFFRIEDRGPGQFVCFEGSSQRTVEVEAWALSENKPMTTLGLKKNGGSGFIHSVAADAGGKSAHFTTSVTVDKSSWFCVYAQDANSLEAVSGAIVVMLDRQLPVVDDNSNVSVQKVIQAVDAKIAQIQGLTFANQSEKDSVLNVFNRAKGFYESLLSPLQSNDPAPAVVTGLRARVSTVTQADYMKIPDIILAPSSMQPIWE